MRHLSRSEYLQHVLFSVRFAACATFLVFQLSCKLRLKVIEGIGVSQICEQ